MVGNEFVRRPANYDVREYIIYRVPNLISWRTMNAGEYVFGHNNQSFNSLRPEQQSRIYH